MVQPGCNNQIVEEAFYIGNTEIIDKDNGLSREYRRSIGGIVIHHVNLKIDGSVGERTDYVLTDNLGSPHTLLDAAGQVVYRWGFDPHGSRTSGDDPRASIPATNPTEGITDRGFTGHEHLDLLGVIHMNGRIYDPKLGRFLQADPLIQDLSNSQSLNRYTYVFNNPLAYTDLFNLCRILVTSSSRSVLSLCKNSWPVCCCFNLSFQSVNCRPKKIPTTTNSTVSAHFLDVFD